MNTEALMFLILFVSFGVVTILSMLIGNRIVNTIYNQDQELFHMLGKPYNYIGEYKKKSLFDSQNRLNNVLLSVIFKKPRWVDKYGLSKEVVYIRVLFGIAFFIWLTGIATMVFLGIK